MTTLSINSNEEKLEKLSKTLFDKFFTGKNTPIIGKDVIELTLNRIQTRDHSIANAIESANTKIRNTKLKTQGTFEIPPLERLSGMVDEKHMDTLAYSLPLILDELRSKFQNLERDDKASNAVL